MKRTYWLKRSLVYAGIVALCGVALEPVITGRTMPRSYLLESTKVSLDRAWHFGAGKWAADKFALAEDAFRVADLEYGHQQARFLLLRDFTNVELMLWDVQGRAELATSSSVRKRNAARLVSQDAIARATRALEKTNAFAGAMNLARYDRSLLQKSKIQLAEANALHGQEEYSLAGERARRVSAQAEHVTNRAAKSAARYSDPGLVSAWRRSIQETVAESRRSGKAAIIVYKDKHVLTLYVGGKPLLSYAAELGWNSVGDKQRSGDSATPEGRYHVIEKKDIGASRYHRALLLDYPNAEDRKQFEQAKRSGRIPPNAKVGGLVEIHGEGGRGKDWTKGCVALANADMDDLFDRIGYGTPVTIVGGDGKGGTLNKLVDMHRATSGAGLN